MFAASAISCSLLIGHEATSSLKVTGGPTSHSEWYMNLSFLICRHSCIGIRTGKARLMLRARKRQRDGEDDPGSDGEVNLVMVLPTGLP